MSLCLCVAECYVGVDALRRPEESPCQELELEVIVGSRNWTQGPLEEQEVLAISPASY